MVASPHSLASQAGVEIFCGFGDTLGHSGLSAGREFSLREAIGEIAEPLDGAGRLLQAIEGEIKLAPVRNAGECETQRGRLVTLGEQIA